MNMRETGMSTKPSKSLSQSPVWAITVRRLLVYFNMTLSVAQIFRPVSEWTVRPAMDQLMKEHKETVISERSSLVASPKVL